jgi:two-component system cell cycle sensor histidine kinase/response regulator CckA
MPATLFPMNIPDPAPGDVNESRRAALARTEAKLHASELRYRRLFESAKDGILILDAESGMVVDVNPYLIERLGFSREEFLGRAIWELGPFKDIVGSKANFAELQQNEYIRYEDKPLETAAGTRFDVEFISNVYLVNGEKVIQCNIRDITARKLAERQLSEQAEILANSHEGVIVESLANKVSFWNPGAEGIFGWAADEARGLSLDEVLGIRDAALLATLRAAVEQTGFWNGEVRAQTREGRKLILDCRMTLVRAQTGRPRARLVFLSDITEKKQLEEKLLRVQRLEAIGTLSGGIAHDLNNILAPILMAAGLLREKLAESRDRELLGLIESAARRGAEVIRQLLTFSRGIEGDRVSMQVRHLVKEMAGIARETFPRNLTWIDDIPRDLWPIVADVTQLHQVLMNLCVNARDAMPAGGTLTVTAKNVQLEKHDTQFGAEALDGPYVLLSVRDTGHGIPRANPERIFDPFFTTKPIGAGTGLGLSTTLGIVRSHGGFITVYSEPGHGSAFHVYLPATPDGVIPGRCRMPMIMPTGPGRRFSWSMTRRLSWSRCGSV